MRCIPTNFALFGHKITLYRFNHGWLILLQGLKWDQWVSAPYGPLTLTTGCMARCVYANVVFNFRSDCFWL